MDTSSIVFLILLTLCVIALIFVFFNHINTRKKIQKLKEENSTFQKELSSLKEENIAIQKTKLSSEEKNKKLWVMSEAVHKERKKVDEENEKLLVEKEKLTADKKKLDEKIKKLWQTSTAVHKEKERINELKLEIEQKHQEIIDSVTYAKRIQRALLPNDALLNQHLLDYFVLFLPRDIVSGDFYWAASTSSAATTNSIAASQLESASTSNENRKFFLAVCDSTGHGVPGAIMSMLNISALNEAVNAEKLTQPNLILDYARKRIMEHMANDGSAEGGKDGMDAVLACFDFKNKKLDFAAANNPLWLIRKNNEGLAELTEAKPDKMPVGKAMGEIKPFALQSIDLQKDDLVILITDGYPDQFGGPKGKKFMYKNLKDTLTQLSDLSTQEIKIQLKTIFDNWRGNNEQVDDVLIIGVRVV